MGRPPRAHSHSRDPFMRTHTHGRTDERSQTFIVTMPALDSASNFDTATGHNSDLYETGANGTVEINYCLHYSVVV
ncbi:hypothetical protein EVAR_12670_1 [Eumeta japonica]|uniref:Uncharacterized protein n=1 Tax=Eumeta variegata TaxID=151549 RepID=A0A4C1YVY3_EUMVA|nr:hypothetical protein EVAR_12670_1 [Eumeta japonica]